jgi:hypothetical protein
VRLPVPPLPHGGESKILAASRAKLQAGAVRETRFQLLSLLYTSPHCKSAWCRALEG